MNIFTLGTVTVLIGHQEMEQNAYVSLKPIILRASIYKMHDELL